MKAWLPAPIGLGPLLPRLNSVKTAGGEGKTIRSVSSCLAWLNVDFISEREKEREQRQDEVVSGKNWPPIPLRRSTSLAPFSFPLLLFRSLACLSAPASSFFHPLSHKESEKKRING